MCMMCREKFKASPVRMADLELASPGPKHPIPIPIPMLRRRVTRPAPTTACCPLFLRPSSGPSPPCLRLAITLSTTKAPGRLWFRCLWGTQSLAANPMCDGGEKGRRLERGGVCSHSIHSPFSSLHARCDVLYFRKAGWLSDFQSRPAPSISSSPNHPSGHQGQLSASLAVAGHGAALPSPHRSLHQTGNSDCPFDGGARGFMESTSLGGAIQFSGQSLLEPAVLLDSGCSAALQAQNRLFVRGANTSDGEASREEKASYQWNIRRFGDRTHGGCLLGESA